MIDKYNLSNKINRYHNLQLVVNVINKKKINYQRNWTEVMERVFRPKIYYLRFCSIRCP